MTAAALSQHPPSQGAVDLVIAVVAAVTTLLLIGWTWGAIHRNPEEDHDHKR